MSGSGYTYIWEYRIEPQMEAAFLECYRPAGRWAELFSGAEGYQRTDLLQDLDDPTRYVTVDYWDSEEAFQAFNERFGAEFHELDGLCALLTVSESPMGRFRTFAP